MKTNRRSAFTLIEVISALLILAIVIPTIMEGIAVADHAADASRRRTEAAGLAQTELATILASESWQTGEQSGDFSPDWPNYSWKSQVVPWPGDAEGAGLDQIDVIVNWTERGKTASLTLSSLAYPRNVASSAASSSTTGTGQ